MLTNDACQAKINNLRVLLNCFYIYLISNACQYAKQVIFQYPSSTSIIYLSIRSLLSAFSIFFSAISILYALWSKRVGIASIAILLWIIFLIIRLSFDLYGYGNGYFEYSLYPPFEYIGKNFSQLKYNEEKAINEEITDFSIELILNLLAILLTILIIIRMIRRKWQRKRQMELEALAMNGIRRTTV